MWNIINRNTSTSDFIVSCFGGVVWYTNPSDEWFSSLFTFKPVTSQPVERIHEIAIISTTGWTPPRRTSFQHSIFLRLPFHYVSYVLWSVSLAYAQYVYCHMPYSTEKLIFRFFFINKALKRTTLPVVIQSFSAVAEYLSLLPATFTPLPFCIFKKPHEFKIHALHVEKQHHSRPPQGHYQREIWTHYTENINIHDKHYDHPKRGHVWRNYDLV